MPVFVACALSLVLTLVAGGGVPAPGDPPGTDAVVRPAAAEAATRIEEVPVEPVEPGTTPDAPPATPALGAGEPGTADLGEALSRVQRVETAVIEGDDVQTIGLTWADGTTDGDVLAPQVRTRDDGTWGPWTELAAGDEAPDAGTAEAAREVRAGTPSLWVGDADAVQFSVVVADGDLPQDLTATLISAEEPASGTAAATTEPTVETAALAAPRIVSRAEWGAAPPTCTPESATRLVGAAVHHTAGSNSYTSPAQAMQQLRNDQRYHMESRGWCDLGYNFVVDRWGNIYEGRVGSLTSPVIGVHAGGFNTGTVGISMLGDYSTVSPSAAMVDAVARIAGFRLSSSGANPQGSMTYRTGGGENSRYPAGATVSLPVIFGHRDVGFTACPGNAGYAQMGRIRQLAASYAEQYDTTLLGADLVRASSGPDVYLVTDSARHRVRDVTVLSALAPLGGIQLVDASALAAVPVGVEVGRFLRDRSGAMYLLDAGRLYTVGDCSELAAWGADCASYGGMALLDSQMARFARGGDLTTGFTTPTGAQYVVSAGRAHEVADAESLAGSALRPNGPLVPLTAAYPGTLPIGAPVVRPRIVVRDRSSGAGVLLDGTGNLDVPSDLLTVTGVERAIPVRPLSPASMAQLPSRRGVLAGAVRAPDGRRVALTMGGGAVVLGSGDVPGDAGVPVPDWVVAALAPTAVPDPLFVRSAQSAALYVLHEGRKRPVPSMEVAAAVTAGRPMTVAVVSAGGLGSVTQGPAALAPGRLVKAQGSSAVLLVDGLGRLVHLPSFEVAAELGTGTSFTEVPSSALAGYTTADRPLGTLLSCGGATYVGWGGRVVRAEAPVLTGSGAPATPLAAVTCANLPQAGATAAPVLVRALGSPALFVLDRGVRRPVPTMDVAFRVAAGGPLLIAVVPGAVLDAVPTGPALLAPGTLVKAQGAPSVYLVDGLGDLVHLPSFDVARTLGVGGGLTEVPAAATAGYAVASRPLSALVTCGGAASLGSGGTVHPLRASVLPASGAPATPLSAMTCANLPRTGSPLGAAVFVHATSSPALFLLEGGVRRPVPTMDAAYRAAGGSPLVVVPVAPAALSAVPLGPSL